MINTRRDFLISSSLASAAITLPTSPAQSNASILLRDSIRDFIRTSIQASGCPGAAVSITKGETAILNLALGDANLETGTPLSSNSIFRVGSLTKQFTAVTVLKLVEQGKIVLDAPVASYLTVFSSLPKFTARELLHHTAGLHSDESNSFLVYTNERSQIALAQEIAKQKQVFDFDPGSAWLYSNSNYIVLGAIIESVYGKPLSTAFEDLLFRPLLLSSTAFDHSASIVRNRVAGYTPTGDKLTPYRNAQWIPIEEAGGAGAVRSTVTDLCRWHELLFGGQVLSSESLKTLLEPGKLRNGAVSGTRRFSPNDQAMGEVQYAMGFLIPPSTAEGKTALHYGYINGFSACLERFIDHGITLAILCNADVNPALPIRNIRREVREHLAGL